MENVRRRRARLKNVIGFHTFEEWDIIRHSTNGVCPSCGINVGFNALTQDHIMSLKLDGSDYAWNLQPLCLSCNSAKGKRIINYLEVWKIVNGNSESLMANVRLDEFPIAEKEVGVV
jgi:5-methylcytosine-specific restriction endonuclease McrA